MIASQSEGHSGATPSLRRSRWTLAQRLSALFVGLLALVIVAFGAAAYRGVHEAAIMRASDRLVSVARELANASARSAVARAASVRALASMPLVQRFAASQSPPQGGTSGSDEAASMPLSAHLSPRNSAPVSKAAIAATLAKTLKPADSTLVGWYILDTHRNMRYGDALAAVDEVRLYEAIEYALGKDGVGRSVIFSSGEQLHFWTAVPIEHDGKVAGVFAELRRVGSSATTEGLLSRLSGQDVMVFFASRGSNEWGSIRGRPVSSPFGVQSADSAADSVAIRIRDGIPQPLYAAAASVAGTPWRIVLTQSETSILDRPRAMLRQLLIIGVLLILVGTFVAGWLSRLETRPLATLRHAAGAMAAGDYSQVVPSAGAEETAALADAFNLMARRISRAHDALAEQNAALQNANEAKARFLAVMSHEMRTPLNAIGGYADLMSLGVQGATTPAQRESLERISRSKEQLLRLVTDILHYARLEATPLPVSRELVTVQEQFDIVRETFTDQFARRGVTLDIASTDSWICADAARVQQVLINLVSNALQFTDAGGVVSLRAVNEGAMTVISVSDTGSGIPPEQQSSIFEPFVQADSSLTRRAGGAGLGLAIVQQLVTAMDGHVSLESTMGTGSTFSVALPNAESPLPECSTQPSLETATV